MAYLILLRILIELQGGTSPQGYEGLGPRFGTDEVGQYIYKIHGMEDSIIGFFCESYVIISINLQTN